MIKTYAHGGDYLNEVQTATIIIAIEKKQEKLKHQKNPKAIKKHDGNIF